MKVIQISDVHFGKENLKLVEDLRRALQAEAPDLIIISGDFTQIGSRNEFQKTRDFINSLSAPVFCIPGNHDVPRFNLWERIIDPFRKYKESISPDLNPVWQNDKIMVVGLNTARRALFHWNWANGAVSEDQLDMIEEKFATAGDRFRVLVLHHPLHRAEGVGLDVYVAGRKKALQKIQDLKIDLVLSGHVHHASITVIGSAVFASASTAISTRLRYQENGFNIIHFSKDYFEISHYIHDHTNFAQTSLNRYSRTDGTVFPR